MLLSAPADAVGNKTSFGPDHRRVINCIQGDLSPDTRGYHHCSHFVTIINYERRAAPRIVVGGIPCIYIQVYCCHNNII